MSFCLWWNVLNARGECYLSHFCICVCASAYVCVTICDDPIRRCVMHGYVHRAGRVVTEGGIRAHMRAK